MRSPATSARPATAQFSTSLSRSWRGTPSTLPPTTTTLPPLDPADFCAAIIQYDTTVSVETPEQAVPYFADLAAMEAALATPTRQAVRAQIAEVMKLFQGRVYHQVFAQD